MRSVLELVLVGACVGEEDGAGVGLGVGVEVGIGIGAGDGFDDV